MATQKKYVLPTLSKTQDIGNTVESLNKSFLDLDNFLNKEKLKNNDINNFVNSINIIYDKLSFACSYIEQNKDNLINISKDVAVNKIKWLKPVILFYNEKFYDRSSIYSLKYIEDLICKWVQANYPVKINNVIKPNYVDGQKAIVFYLKTIDTTETFSYNNLSPILCQTEDSKVALNCTTSTTGKACIAACGCVNCANTVHCKQTKITSCFFKDKFTKSQSIYRHLELNCEYINEDTKDVAIYGVNLIVKDCIWKIDKTLPAEEVKKLLELEYADDTDVIKGLVTFEGYQISNFVESMDLHPF
jgi:hypothetical protein